MSERFLINFLRAYDGVPEHLFPIIVPEICTLLLSFNLFGGEVLYLLTSRSNVSLLGRVIEALHGLFKIDPSHWDYIIQKKVFSNKCVVTGEKISNIDGFLYISDHKRYVNYFSYQGVQELFSREDIKCPKTGTLINWYVPLFVLQDELIELIDAGSPVADNSCHVDQLEPEEEAESLKLKYGNDKFPREFLKLLTQYKLRSSISRYAYGFNQVFKEWPMPIFIKLCLIYDIAPLLNQWVKRPEDRILLRQLLFKHNKNANLFPDTLFILLYEQDNAKPFIEQLIAGDAGFEWIQALLKQSVNNKEQVILQKFIKNHPSNLECQKKQARLKNKRKLIFSEVKDALCGDAQEQPKPQAKHIRFFDESRPSIEASTINPV